MKNKIKLNKKKLVNLSDSKRNLPNNLTPNVAGGMANNPYACTDCASGCHELVN
ncbi:hypothetical protein [Pseudoalteromonas byunsanensis]|uniref:hypothetical protein n=1 Tax=Pseudoalteromonas byunsanensis TaxID=327939 RepID=UPI001586F6BF|nr:hypothetical protein [Pseudoalteromonas byunsanensis]